MKLKKSWMKRMATWMLEEAAQKRAMRTLRAENQRLRTKYSSEISNEEKMKGKLERGLAKKIQ